MKYFLYIALIGMFALGTLIFIQPYKADADIGSSYNIPILELKYFPLKSGNSSYLDPIETLEDPDALVSVSQKRSDVQNISSMTIAKLEEGSNYIKDLSGTHAVDYNIIQSEEFLKKIPRSAISSTIADHFAIDNDLKNRTGKGFCDFVDGQGVKEIWIWMYHTSTLAPIESNMSMGNIAKPAWNYSNYGDVSNSGRDNDLPICQRTYTVYNYNYFRGTAEAMHNHGHQLESLFGFADYDMFWNKFVRPTGQSTSNNCGDTHHPPNTTGGYDYANTNSVYSSCTDWRPDGSGSMEFVNCANWSCADEGGLTYYVWWMRRIPGRNNTLSLQNQKLRNWWDLVGDFDAQILRSRTLFEPLPPIANADSDQSVKSGSFVTLNGTASSDPDGQIPLKYQWLQISGPIITLSSATSQKPTFVAPSVSSNTNLIFSLTVIDTANLKSPADTVTISIKKQSRNGKSR